jgi:hypothetical protein
MCNVRLTLKVPSASQSHIILINFFHTPNLCTASESICLSVFVFSFFLSSRLQAQPISKVQVLSLAVAHARTCRHRRHRVTDRRANRFSIFVFFLHTNRKNQFYTSAAAKGGAKNLLALSRWSSRARCLLTHLHFTCV